MNEVQENVSSRFGSKTRVVFTTSPGYASMPPALQFVYAVLISIAEGDEWRILMAAPNRELEPTKLRLRKSEMAAAWADVSHALRGFYELADILIVLEGGPLARDIELHQTAQVQSGHRRRPSGNKSLDGQLVVSKHAFDDHEFHQ